MKRYIFTGAPGAGKTALLNGLAALGYPVIGEAATDFIAAEQARGVSEPGMVPAFINHILSLQMARQRDAIQAPILLFDRSPICTLALARYLGQAPPQRLLGEVSRLVAERYYERPVFLVRPLGFIETTAVRTITYEDALAFEALHEATYESLGFDLLEISKDTIERRVAQVDRIIATLP